MAMAREAERNDTPKTASGNHIISDYRNGQSRWYFDATVQSTGPEFDPSAPYDKVDYFSFRHFDGLTKVNWNMSFLMSNMWNFEEAGGIGGTYSLGIKPGGAFQGKAVSVTVKTGFANYVDEWYGYNEAWRQVDAVLQQKWQMLHQAGQSTTQVDKSLEIMDDLQGLLEQIPGADSSELDTIELALRDILAINSNQYDESSSIRAMAEDFEAMAAGWDRLHYYLGNGNKEVFLREMSERITWSVKGNGPGYIAFSGGVTTYESFYDFQFTEAHIPKNWYLEVQSETRPRNANAHPAMAGEASDVAESFVRSNFDIASDYLI